MLLTKSCVVPLATCIWTLIFYPPKGSNKESNFFLKKIFQTTFGGCYVSQHVKRVLRASQRDCDLLRAHSSRLARWLPLDPVYSTMLSLFDLLLKTDLLFACIIMSTSLQNFTKIASAHASCKVVWDGSHAARSRFDVNWLYYAAKSPATINRALCMAPLSLFQCLCSRLVLYMTRGFPIRKEVVCSGPRVAVCCRCDVLSHIACVHKSLLQCCFLKHLFSL